MKQFSAESILLPLQKMQQAHDEAAHRDILSFDMYKRLQHMVLHFYKYTWKVDVARASLDVDALRHTLLDAFIISMASANAINVSLGEFIDARAEARSLDSLCHELAKRLDGGDPVHLFDASTKALTVFGGQMAKAIESTDHMELGDPRALMNDLVPKMAGAVLGVLGHLGPGLDAALRQRLAGVERKSIFLRLDSDLGL